MRYQKKGGALQMPPPPPPALPFSAAKGKLPLPPPPPPPTLTPELVNVITKKKGVKPVVVNKKGVAPGEPGVPIPIGGEDYRGRVNSTIDPAYDVYLETYYADFSIRDENGFMKLFRMFGNSPTEVIQYIANFKESAKLHGMVRAAEPITLNSIIRQLETLRRQKQN